MRRHLLYIYTICLLLTACEHEIPYNGEYQDSKLLVEAYACAGEDSMVCCVGRTYFILDDKPYRPEVLEGLDISLEGASGPYKIISDSVDGRQHYMKLSRPVKAGEELRLTVSHPQFGTAYAKETLMPEFIPEVSAYRVEEAGGMMDRHIVTLQLPDYPEQTETGWFGRLYATRIAVTAKYNTGHTIQTGWDTVATPYVSNTLCSFDPAFANMGNEYYERQGYYSGSVHTPLMMRSAYTAGKQLDVHITVPASQSYSTGSITYRVDSFLLGVEVKSEAYKLYQTSMEKYLQIHQGYGMTGNDENESGGMMFSSMGTEENVSVYNNVENGYGVFISKTKTKIRVK